MPSAGTVDPSELRAARVAIDAIDGGQLHGLLSALGLAETLYALGRERVALETRRAIEWQLTQGLFGRLTIVAVDTALATAAAAHRLAHYHRERSPISYADSVSVVMAERAGVQLLTVDAPLLALGDSRIMPPSQLRLSRS